MQLMSPMIIAAIVFACIFGSALLGMFLRTQLPEHHLKEDSKDIVKLGTGLIATLAALVLGLLVASAKGSFDKVNDELVQMAGKIILLDRVLALYGPDTKEVRSQIQSNYTMVVELLFSGDAAKVMQLDTPEAVTRVEAIQVKLRELAPQNDSQRALQSRALELVGELAAARWHLLVQKDSSIPTPFLVVLVFWVSVLFASFGLFSPRNALVIGILLVCALSVAGAIFLILELNNPFGGLMRVSSVPFQQALAHLGQ
jgi:hypothetical protein